MTSFFMLAGASFVVGSEIHGKNRACCDSEKPNEDSNNPFSKDSMFEIPKLIQDREAKMKEEYAKREKIDIEQITEGEFSREEVEEMQEADSAYLFDDDSKGYGED